MGASARIYARLEAYVPSPHILAVALKTARCLHVENQSLELFRGALVHLPSDGLYTLDNLLEAEELLVRACVAERDGTSIKLIAPIPPSIELLASRYLEHSPPAWLGAATKSGDIDYTMVPTEDARILADVLGDPDRRDCLLLAIGRKFDDRYRQQLGREGEEAVVVACRRHLQAAGASELADEVMQVSLISDQLGYDVRTPTLAGGVLRLEVKTEATANEDPRFYLSRNEWETGIRDAVWRLVVCRREPSGDIIVTGWVDAESLRTHIPPDTGAAKWQSIVIVLPSAEINPGLPDLVDV